MPVQSCQAKGKSGYKWGQSGKCFIGRGSRAKAARQGRAIQANNTCMCERWKGRTLFINGKKIFDPSIKPRGLTSSQYLQIHNDTSSSCNCHIHNQRTRIVPSNPLKSDPTRSKTLRRAFETEFRKRFQALSRAILELVVTEDAFGLKQRQPFSFNQEQNNAEQRTGLSELQTGNKRAATSIRRKDRRAYTSNIQSRHRNEGTSKDSSETTTRNQQGKNGKVESNTTPTLTATQNQEQNNGLNRQDEITKNRGEAIGDVGENQRITGRTSKYDEAHDVKAISRVQNQRFAFQSSAQQVASFRAWLEGQIEANILPASASTGADAYWDAFVEEGYRKGQGRAFTDSRPAVIASGNPEQLAFYEGTKAEFLASSFGSPVAIEKVQLLSGRVFTELRGVTQAMAQGITRELTEGLSRGESPFVIARRMQDEIRGIGMRRATLIARTEITRTHAEGQLDAMERLGVEQVGVAVEWSTAGDDRVCPLCLPLDGVVMSLKEARGIIPRHTQCRCAFIPANVGESQKDQIRTKGGIDSAFSKSVGKERPKFKHEIVPGQFTPTGRPVRRRVGISKETVKQAKRKSPWKGADTKVKKNRPKGLLDDIAEKRKTSDVIPPDTRKTISKPPTKKAKPSRERPKRKEPLVEVRKGKPRDGLFKPVKTATLGKGKPKLKAVIRKPSAITKPKTEKKKVIPTKPGKAVKKPLQPKVDVKAKEATQDYTTDAFQKVNKGLRKGKIIDKRIVSGTDKYLKDSPKFGGNTVRSFNVTEKEKADLLKQLNDGKVIDKAFVSTRKNPTLTDRIALEDGSIAKERVVFRVKGKSGVDVSDISLNPSEGEVLYPRNVQFKVTGFTQGKSGGIIADLEEIL